MLATTRCFGTRYSRRNSLLLALLDLHAVCDLVGRRAADGDGKVADADRLFVGTRGFKLAGSGVDEIVDRITAYLELQLPVLDTLIGDVVNSARLDRGIIFRIGNL